MTSLRNRLLAVAALALAALPFGADRALAVSQVMCAPEAAIGSQPRQVNNPNTNNTYSLSGQGCAAMRSDDAAYFAAQGFTQGSNVTTLVFAQKTTGFNFVVPLSQYIRNILVHEDTGNATSSGICVGTTNGGSDVATYTGAASSLSTVSDVSLAKRVLSATVATTVFFGSCAATGFGSAAYDVTVELAYF